MTLNGPSDFVGTGSPSYVLPNAGFHTVPRSNSEEEHFLEALVLSQPRGNFTTPGITISQLDGQSVIINRNPYEDIDRVNPPSVHSVQRSPSHGRLRRNISSSRLNAASPSMNPHGVSRSQSLRTSRRPQPHDSNQKFRQRIASIPCDITTEAVNGSCKASSNHSLPLPGDETDYTRLRNFSVTPKGVINRGDSFRSKSRSSHSVQSNGSGQRIVISVHQPSPPNELFVADSTVDKPEDQSVDEVSRVFLEPTPVCSSNDGNTSNVKYRVLIIGSAEVGKTALTMQFTTSEYICSYEPSHDEKNENSVTVILNGEESELVFVEHQCTEDVKTLLNSSHPDAILVIYSVVQKTSFQQSKYILNHIARMEDAESKAIILVGNKTDLVRLRTVTTEDGRTLAKAQNCKFIETSVGINHNVDELLAGIVSQIRLKVKESEKHGKGGDVLKGGRGRSSGCPGCKARGILKRILKKACSRSKSCDNLHVL